MSFLDGETVLTFCADGVHGAGALYRYELHLTRSDMDLLRAAVGNG
ncbi:MAG: hypothetical protein KL801_05490 [Mesorhizobium sp.]|nr:hypothetical protein [Mesorhizobium sp.]